MHVAAAPELFDHTLWVGTTDECREELARRVAAELGPEFTYVGLRRYGQASAPVAVFAHASVGELSLVPGGGFDMGLSPEEEATIRAARQAAAAADHDFDQEFDLLLSEIGQMRPLHRVVVPPFLIAQRVLSIGQALRWLPNLRDPLYGHVSKAAAHLNPEQITAVLVGTGLRLPAEAELEYAARGGLHRRLLPWGDALPDDAAIEAMLADEDGATHNAFGVHGYGLFPELCADHWHDHYRGAPDDGAPWLRSGMHVVRGGAADCYPWQGCGEWNLMLCAMRMNEHAAEFGASVRLVYGLGEHEGVEVEVAEETGEAKRPSRQAGGQTGSKAARKAVTSKAGAKKAAKKSGAKEVSETRAKQAGKKGAKAGAKEASETRAKQVGKKGAKAGAKEASETRAKQAGKKGAKAGAKKVSKTGAKKVEPKRASQTGAKKAATKKASETEAKKASETGAKKKRASQTGAKKAATKKTSETGGKKASKAGAKKAASKKGSKTGLKKAGAKKAGVRTR